MATAQAGAKRKGAAKAGSKMRKEAVGANPSMKPSPVAVEAATRPTTDDETEPTLPVAPPAQLPRAGKRLMKDVAKNRKKSVKLSSRCGILLPPALVKKHLIRARAAPKISLGASIFLTAAIETLVSELFLGSIEACRAGNKRVLTAQHFLSAIRTDEELNKIFCDVIVPRGGNPSVFPIHQAPVSIPSKKPPPAHKNGGVQRPPGRKADPEEPEAPPPEDEEEDEDYVMPADAEQEGDEEEDEEEEEDGEADGEEPL